MKKYYLLLFFVTSFLSAQIVNIPDANFKAKLLESNPSNQIATNLEGNYFKIDSNNNGEIEIIEALEVKSLGIIYIPSIYSVVGIESFTNLNSLNITGTEISSINLVSLVNLATLILNENNIDALDISTLLNLQTLYCENNNLIVLDLTSQTMLENVYVNSNSITSITFNTSANLKKVHCNYNQLTSLDFTSFPTLKEIYCSYNSLNSLDVDNLTLLEKLSCTSNQLINLDISDLINLHSLQCSNNLLSTLNLSGPTSLNVLYCDNNLLTTLDLTQLNHINTISLGNVGFNPMNLTNLSNPNIVYIFNFWGGIQTSLDLSIFPNLTQSALFNTNLINVDFSQNTTLTDIGFINNVDLLSLNIKNGSTETISVINGSPNLLYICADENQISNVQINAGSNVMVSSYCSFTQGGNYNTISGLIQFDSNNNGCDATDLPQPNIKININDGINQGATFTNASGNYSFLTQTGSFEITPDVENPSYFNFSPISATIPFADNNDNTVTQNFCITPNGEHSDLEVVIVPLIPARPGFDAVYKIVYKNKGNQTDTGYVNFTYNDAILDFVSSSILPNNNGGGFMNWIIPNIAPFQSGNILVTLNVNSPQETPSVNIDDVLVFNAFIDVSTDDIWADNNFDFNQIVVGSYDPNDITCLQGNALPATEMGEFLHYNIRFENTGTYAAENIVVKNEIDLTQYNIQSLQVMESSHPMKVKVTGNIAEFIFQNIDLDTGGHGNILLKLKSNTTLSNDLVINSADIFFDYNFPIITNDEQTVFANLSKNDFVKDASIQVYPNPTNDVINVKADNTINSIQLYDAQGRLLLTKSANENSQVLDLSSYSSGIYFINTSTSIGKQTQKIIKN